jgi:myo-inositol-1(or 4)-monophosphatase
MSLTTVLLEVAIAGVTGAGTLLLDDYFRSDGLVVDRKSGPDDLVTSADLASHRFVVSTIRGRRPHDRVVSEEGVGEAVGGEVTWIVDPLDGTTNFVYGVPHWAVSIAALDAHDSTICAAVFDPCRGELFTASTDQATQMNGHTVTVRPECPISRALVTTGFAPDGELRAFQARVVTALALRCRDLRRTSSPALDLAWVAAGRSDAYIEHSLGHSDVAPGSHLVDRAGGATARLHHDDHAGILAASGPNLRDALLAALVDAVGITGC